MSDTQTTPKTPLWKQLLGAVAGATVAFVIYQGYTFTADHLTALTTGIPTRFSQPTGTIESPSYFSSSSMAPSASSISSAASSARAALGPFGTIRGQKKFFQFGASSSAAAVAAVVASSSSVSSEMVTVIPADNEATAQSSSSVIAVPTWISPEVPMQSPPEPIPAEISPWETVVTHSEQKLPQSGFGLDVLAVTALGAVIGRRKAKGLK